MLVCAGCSFRAGAGGVTDASGPSEGPGNHIDIDAPQPLALHLAADDGRPGDSPLTLTGAVSIDTSAPSISVPLSGSDAIDVRSQLGGGPELAVLHVSGLTVASGAVVSITG